MKIRMKLIGLYDAGESGAREQFIEMGNKLDRAKAESTRLRAAIETADHVDHCAARDPLRPGLSCNCWKVQALGTAPSPALRDTPDDLWITAEHKRQIEQKGWTPKHVYAVFCGGGCQFILPLTLEQLRELPVTLDEEVDITIERAE